MPDHNICNHCHMVIDFDGTCGCGTENTKPDTYEFDMGGIAYLFRSEARHWVCRVSIAGPYDRSIGVSIRVNADEVSVHIDAVDFIIAKESQDLEDMHEALYGVLVAGQKVLDDKYGDTQA